MVLPDESGGPSGRGVGRGDWEYADYHERRGGGFGILLPGGDERGRTRGIVRGAVELAGGSHAAADWIRGADICGGADRRPERLGHRCEYRFGTRDDGGGYYDLAGECGFCGRAGAWRNAGLGGEWPGRGVEHHSAGDGAHERDKRDARCLDSAVAASGRVSSREFIFHFGEQRWS